MTDKLLMKSSCKLKPISNQKLKAVVYFYWLYIQRLITEKRRWLNVEKNGFTCPRLYFGHDCIPSRKQRSSGSFVKFQDLSEEFPNTVQSANILYLVSSALPPFPEIMVKEAKKNGALLVLNQNGVAYPAWHGPGWGETNLPMQYLLDKANYVIYQSEFSKASADKFLGPCKSPWTVLHNPVDTQTFQPSDNRLSGIKLLLAGSHQHFYRIQSALEMVQQILSEGADISLTIAGRYAWRNDEIDCLAESRSFAEKLRISEQVKFLGRYTQDEAPGLFQRHHILVHTQYNDCCPRLVVEAMASGLPIVYSESGGVPELVGEEAGVGVPAPLDWEQIHSPSPKILARAVMSVIASLENYSVAARNRATERFDVRHWLKRHAEIFQELLKKKCNVI